jgi:hypothetical protein
MLRAIFLNNRQTHRPFLPRWFEHTEGGNGGTRAWVWKNSFPADATFNKLGCGEALPEGRELICDGSRRLAIQQADHLDRAGV